MEPDDHHEDYDHHGYGYGHGHGVHWTPEKGEPVHVAEHEHEDHHLHSMWGYEHHG